MDYDTFLEEQLNTYMSSSIMDGSSGDITYGGNTIATGDFIVPNPPEYTDNTDWSWKYIQEQLSDTSKLTKEEVEKLMEKKFKIFSWKMLKHITKLEERIEKLEGKKEGENTDELERKN